MTIAEQIAGLLNGNGQCWQDDDGRDFEDIMEHHEAVTEVRGDLTRYLFPDGSAIVAAPSGWDVEGVEPFSFESI